MMIVNEGPLLAQSGRTPMRSRQLSATSESETARNTSTTLNDIVQSVLDEISGYRHGAFKCIGDCRQFGNRSN
jgi:hypothetical protein